ncbi:12990_t:CDS:2 [Cetraspora pellucida]|uniref:12990_t:CDS:1 n=1 Tax=Cetraspora pellucida TaxID=1433469 RepID=A0A9N9GUM3_9GLOM|nr:12990_t:CDS:2 [Cetraspora pellucida]
MNLEEIDEIDENTLQDQRIENDDDILKVFQKDKQNNLSNIQQIKIAENASKRFSNKTDEDIDKFIKDYKFYLTVANINTD